MLALNVYTPRYTLKRKLPALRQQPDGPFLFVSRTPRNTGDEQTRPCKKGSDNSQKKADIKPCSIKDPAEVKQPGPSGQHFHCKNLRSCDHACRGKRETSPPLRLFRTAKIRPGLAFSGRAMVCDYVAGTPYVLSSLSTFLFFHTQGGYEATFVLMGVRRLRCVFLYLCYISSVHVYVQP